MGTSIDTRVWNLGVPVGLLLAGCGRTDILAAGNDSVAESATESTTESTTMPGGCKPKCPPGYQCIDGACQYYGCLDYCCYDGDPCCNDPCCGDPCCGDPCCGETGGNCGYCSGNVDCPSGYYCSQCGGCYIANSLPPCRDPVQFVAAIPMPPMIDDAAFSLAFMDINGDPARDLLMASGSGVAAVLGPDASTPLEVPFNGPGMLAVADLDGDGDDDAVRAWTNDIEIVVGQPGVGLSLGSSEFAPVPAAAIALPDVDANGDADVVIVGGSAQSGAIEEWQLVSTSGGLARPTLLDSSLDIPSLAAARPGAGALGYVAVHEPNAIVTRFSPSGETYWLWDGFFAGLGGQLATADLFADGRPDVASSGSVDGISTLAGLGIADMYITDWFRLQGVFSLLAGGDIAGDDSEDLLFASSTRVLIVRGSSVAAFCTTEYEMPISVAVAAIGDHTGDGVEDLAISDGTQTMIMVRAP